jgi:hypothetical protein
MYRFDYPTIIDHPNVRESASCPTCNRPKDQGLLVCWDCYRKLDIRNGLTPAIALIIENAEEELV